MLEFRIVKVFPSKTDNNYDYRPSSAGSEGLCWSAEGSKGPWARMYRSFCYGLMLKLLPALTVSSGFLLHNQKVVVMMLFQYHNYDSPKFCVLSPDLVPFSGTLYGRHLDFI